MQPFVHCEFHVQCFLLETIPNDIFQYKGSLILWTIPESITQNVWSCNLCTNKNHSYQHNEQINNHNIDNAECLGVTFVKIYPEMTSQQLKQYLTTYFNIKVHWFFERYRNLLHKMYDLVIMMVSFIGGLIVQHVAKSIGTCIKKKKSWTQGSWIFLIKN
jgi:hypothetical protein